MTLAATISGTANGLAVTAALAWGMLLGGPVSVIDGDTIDRGIYRYRLAGFDAPELRRARCPAERAAALAAKARLESLLTSGGKLALVPVKARDPYGRIIARLEIDGADVAATAIAEGWGVAYHGRGKRLEWCGTEAVGSRQ